MIVDDSREKKESEDRSFGEILAEFDGSRPGKPAGRSPLRGVVVGISGDFVLVDYGRKSEGVIPKADLLDADGNLSVNIGETVDVTVTGRNSEGMATLSVVTGP